jgi:hypothetical membrane protein
MTRTKVGAVLWIFCLQYFAAEAVSIYGWPGSYSLRQNYISDLGAVGCDIRASGLAGATQTLCSPLHGVMNASFLLQGLLIAFGTALVWPLFPRGKLWAIALLLIGASGVGVFIVGLAPEDVSPKLHFIGAVENFLSCNAGMTAMGIAMLSWTRATRLTGLIVFSLGATGLLALGFLAMRIYPGLGVGGMERLTAYPFPLWLAGMGALLLRKPSRASPVRINP